MTDKGLKLLIETIGEERTKEYIKEYLSCKAPKEEFITYFREYLDTRYADENGTKNISTQGFSYFILDKMYGTNLDDENINK